MPVIDLPKRKRLRLEGYDYAWAGAYFVTICTHQGEMLFGQIVGEEMEPNQFGLIVQRGWRDLPNHYPHIVLDAFVIMPNHVHGIIVIQDIDSSDRGGSFAKSDGNVGKGGECGKGGRGGSTSVSDLSILQGSELYKASANPTQTRPYARYATENHHGLPEIVRAFKSFSARRINAIRKTPGVPVWQRNYFEHIIRDEKEWQQIRDYIFTNPQNWVNDQHFLSPNH